MMQDALVPTRVPSDEPSPDPEWGVSWELTSRIGSDARLEVRSDGDERRLSCPTPAGPALGRSGRLTVSMMAGGLSVALTMWGANQVLGPRSGKELTVVALAISVAVAAAVAVAVYRRLARRPAGPAPRLELSDDSGTIRLRVVGPASRREPHRVEAPSGALLATLRRTSGAARERWEVCDASGARLCAAHGGEFLPWMPKNSSFGDRPFRILVDERRFATLSLPKTVWGNPAEGVFVRRRLEIDPDVPHAPDRRVVVALAAVIETRLGLS